MNFISIKIWISIALLLPVLAMAQKFNVSGTVKDGANGETMISAMIYTEDGNYGTATNAYGYYTLELPLGTYT